MGPRSHALCLRMTLDVKALLDAEALRTGESLSDIIHRIVRSALDRCPVSIRS